MDIRIVEDDEIFKETVNRYINLKSQKKELDSELDKCLATFQEYADIDLDSNFEGKVNLICGIAKVVLEYKFNRSIDSNKLAELCKRTGKPAQTYVKVSFEYPNKTMLKKMDTEAIDELKKCAEVSRAKTSVKIDI